MTGRAAGERDLSPRTCAWGVALAVALGGAARIAGGFSDFWLDEIWTWATVQRLHGPWEVFTAIHHSNNNHLNTLLVYWLGNPGHWIVYRIPSLAAGIATIGLCAVLARARGRIEALLAAVLCAGCFALLHFSSEARGYAIAVACALAAAAILQRHLAAPRTGTALAFGVAIALGLLAHLVVVFFWAATIAQSAWRWRGEPRRALGRLVGLHGLPLAVLAALWAVDLRYLTVGGGNPTDVPMLAARTVGFTFGLPVVRGLGPPVAALALGVLAWAALRRLRRGDDTGVLYGVAIAAPVAGFALLRPEVVAVRYFLVAIALSLVLLADPLAAGLRAGGPRRVAALVALAVFLGGNGIYVARFLTYGRGGYRSAVQTMARATEGPVIRVASDHDFRNRLVLRFYARELGPGRRLVYVPRARWADGDVEWFVVHRADNPAPDAVPAEIVGPGGRRFARFAEFPHAAISGFHWTLYRRIEPSGASRRRRMTVPNPPPVKGSAPRRSTRS